MSPPLSSCGAYPVCCHTQLSPGRGYSDSLQAEQEPGVSLPREASPGPPVCNRSPLSPEKEERLQKSGLPTLSPLQPHHDTTPAHDQAARTATSSTATTAGHSLTSDFYVPDFVSSGHRLKHGETLPSRSTRRGVTGVTVTCSGFNAFTTQRSPHRLLSPSYLSHHSSLLAQPPSLLFPTPVPLHSVLPLPGALSL